MKSVRTWVFAAACMFATGAGVGIGAGLAYAKLPQAPMDDAAKAKAEEVKAKAAEAAKTEGEQLAKAQDRAADRYKNEKGIKTASPKKK